MKSQPNRDYVSDDVVQTPLYLAHALVAYFKPAGRVLEPCRGEGNIYRFLPKGSEWCELSEGRDFLAWEGRVNWIVTNPPWSKARAFLQKSMEVSDNVVFLITVNHLWTKARIRDMKNAGFGIKAILTCDMPPSFPQSGFQLGAIHLKKGWAGETRIAPLPLNEDWI